MKTKILIAVLSIGLLTVTSANSQEREPAKMKHEQMAKATYTCPMHTDMKSDKPGKCTQCGMEMKKMDMDHSKMNMHKDSIEMKMKPDSIKMSHEKMSKMYTCPMHSDVVSDKAGKCSKCGMMMVEKKMEMKKQLKKDQATQKKESEHKDHKH